MYRMKNTDSLTSLSIAFTGRPFEAFLAFASEARRANGYVPTIAPRGPRQADRDVAKRLADAFEARGLRVWRGL